MPASTDFDRREKTFWKSIEISASVFPLVSGTALAMKIKPAAQNKIVLPCYFVILFVVFFVFFCVFLCFLWFLWLPRKETAE